MQGKWSQSEIVDFMGQPQTIEIALRQGIAGLLWHFHPDVAIPESLQRLRGQEVLRHHQQASLQIEISQLLTKVGVELVFYKGIHCCQLYPEPALRPKVDIDLLVAREAREQVFELLESRGFKPVASNYSEVVLPERTFAIERNGIMLGVDLHWQISARPLLAEKLSLAYLRQRAEGDFPDLIDALLIASAHRVGHHRDRERLLWIYDIHLLWARIDQTTLAERASATGLSCLLHDALSVSQLLFDTQVSESYLQRLLQQGEFEPARALLGSIGNFSFDWMTARNGKIRRKLISERLFANREYLQARFGPGPNWLWQIRRWAASLVLGAVSGAVLGAVFSAYRVCVH